MKAVVIDANIALSQVLESTYSELAAYFLESSHRSRDRLLVPTLWWYEVVSGLRRAVAGGILTRVQAHEAVDQISLLQVESIPPSQERNHSALHWSEKTVQTKAYDGQYLALAEQFRAEFWTADQRLVNAARQAGSIWVHWIGEFTLQS